MKTGRRLLIEVNRDEQTWQGKDVKLECMVYIPLQYFTQKEEIISCRRLCEDLLKRLQM